MPEAKSKPPRPTPPRPAIQDHIIEFPNAIVFPGTAEGYQRPSLDASFEIRIGKLDERVRTIEMELHGKKAAEEALDRDAEKRDRSQGMRINVASILIAALISIAVAVLSHYWPARS